MKVKNCRSDICPLSLKKKMYLNTDKLRECQHLLFLVLKDQLKSLLKIEDMGAWVAQSIEHLTSAQVMISRSVSSSPASGSMLTAQSLEPVSDSVSPSLSLTLPHSCSVSLCLKNK